MVSITARRAARTALLASALLAGAAQAEDTPHWVHYRLLNGSATLPKKVVVIPASVKVFEVTAGGVEEEVPAWSAEASTNILSAVSSALGKAGRMQEIKLQRLTGSDAAAVDEHMALYKLVVGTAVNSGLRHKVRRFDYTIGPGLASVLGKTGADAVVMVYGRDEASTAGRKAKAVLGKIPFVNLLSGDAELGDSYIHIGLIDLRTGDLLWMNSEQRGSTSNLRDAGDAQSVVSSVFKWYPGVEEYRKAYAK